MTTLLFSRPARRARAAGALFLLLLLLLSAAPPGQADEVTRRVQEELRKRNLYYGDIDGRSTRAVAGALSRYQERKGFPASGVPDETTLRSLNIAPFAADGDGGDTAPPLPPDAWPPGPVLKSDHARRDPERRRPPPPTVEADATLGAGATDLATDNHENPPADNTAPDARLAPPPAGAIITAPPLGATPPPDAAPTTLTETQARVFLQAYLRACERNRLDDEMKFYSDHVDYFDQGLVDHAFIRRDVRRYYARWPERTFELLEPFGVAAGPREGESTVRFLVRFRYHRRPAGRGAREMDAGGQTDNIFVLQGSRPEDLRIVAMREQRLRP